MEQLVDKGQVVRVARGIYCYPKKDKVWNTGFLPYDRIFTTYTRRTATNSPLTASLLVSMNWSNDFSTLISSLLPLISYLLPLISSLLTFDF